MFKVGVLKGGVSEEREISLRSGEAVYEALKELGMDVSALDIVGATPTEFRRQIGDSGIRVAFIALHGRFGEDGTAQQLLDEMGVAYTGSGPQASRRAMDKAAARECFGRAGLRVPAGYVVGVGSGERDAASGRYPKVVKPVASGSSVGLSIVYEKEQLPAALSMARKYDHRVLLEDYVAGRELTVGILGDLALPVVEIIPRREFFDYTAKYTAGITDYVVPAEMPQRLSARAREVGLTAHRALGCRGASRVDMILDKEERLFVLEVNTVPGMTRTSLLPRAAQAAGIGFGELCRRILRLSGKEKRWQNG